MPNTPPVAAVVAHPLSGHPRKHRESRHRAKLLQQPVRRRRGDQPHRARVARREAADRTV